MTVDVLYSGSRGNATLVRTEKTAILIDCGKSARALSAALSSVGASDSDISAVFITHEHSDHTSALDSFLGKHPVPVHITAPSAENLSATERIASCAEVHDVCYTASAGDLTVRSFPVPHDSAACVGYVIEDESGDVFGIATDIGHVTDGIIENLSGCRRVVLEANHDVEMLQNGRYPAFLKRRIRSPRGHLSNDEGAELALCLADAGVSAIALAHLSPENNVPSVAYNDIRCALDASGHADCELVVADLNFAVHLPEVKSFAEN